MESQSAGICKSGPKSIEGPPSSMFQWVYPTQRGAGNLDRPIIRTAVYPINPGFVSRKKGCKLGGLSEAV
jgi:hypothetical protein